MKTSNCVAQLKGILTLAYGSKMYVDQGVALGRSLNIHCGDIPTAVVTDSTCPELHSLFDIVIPLDASRGTGVVQKLYIDMYSPFEKTLFIDCDSIVVRNLGFAFALFNESKACVIGTELYQSTEVVDVANVETVLHTLSIDSLPKFNGGVYFIDRTTSHVSMMEKARELAANYADYGFLEFRSDGPADEMLIGAAMTIVGCTSVCDGARLMRTPIGTTGKLQVDSILGKAAFLKYGIPVTPAIVHFAGPFQKDPVYDRERLKLQIYHQTQFFRFQRAVFAGWRFELRGWIGALGARGFKYLPRPIRLFVHGCRNLKTKNKM